MYPDFSYHWSSWHMTQDLIRGTFNLKTVFATVSRLNDIFPRNGVLSGTFSLVWWMCQELPNQQERMALLAASILFGWGLSF